MTKAVQQWVDPAMFSAEPSDGQSGPQVYLLQGTPDPLGSVVAFSSMYTGKVVRDKRDVTDEERRYHLEQMKLTKLAAPLEAVNLHWMVEGVTRSFTHQMVRQRTAVYAQESLRFAVKEDAANAVALPPSLAGVNPPTPLEDGMHVSKEQEWLFEWDSAVEAMDEAYQRLVNSGMPAEDARGLLPHNITTRLNYATNLRNFQDHAGNRLCTQAQFEWRAVWAGFVEALRNYCTGPYCKNAPHVLDTCDNWQWAAISELFRPVCYYTGKCEFMAEFDRACSIRERVQANHGIGRGSVEWNLPFVDPSWQEPVDASARVITTHSAHDGREETIYIAPISPAEWLADPAAAR